MSSLGQIATVPVEDLSSLSGLICGHENCGALFVDPDESIAHANACHDGKEVARTCGVREIQNKTGDVELVLADEEDLQKTG
jgi:hypothetical protein